MRVIEAMAPRGRRANSGGPMSRTRKERIRSSLLGKDDGPIRCPRILRVGIDFPSGDPVEILNVIVDAEGYAGPDELRGVFELPDHALLARPFADSNPVVHARYDAPRDVLWNALVLGLCTGHFYDPARPVLWTQSSLTRRLELFDPAGFYA